jgi:hypothetical protein
MSKEYKDRHEKPLVNPPVTLEDLKKEEPEYNIVEQNNLWPSGDDDYWTW